MSNTALCAAAVACALAASPAAHASAGEMKMIERVELRGLDLASKAGRAELESRIRWAASRVCSDYERPAPTGLSVNRDCFEAAMKDALQQLDRAAANRMQQRRIAVASTKR